MENSEISSENLEKKKEKYKEVLRKCKWTEFKYSRNEQKDSIKLSPRINSPSPKFSHKMFVQNPKLSLKLYSLIEK